MTIRSKLERGTPPGLGAVTVPSMAKTAAAGVDVGAVEAHLARYAVSCPLCKAVDQLGVGHHPCRIESANGVKDSIPAVVVVCKRCGFLMPLAADHIAA